MTRFWPRSRKAVETERRLPLRAPVRELLQRQAEDAKARLYAEGVADGMAVALRECADAYERDPGQFGAWCEEALERSRTDRADAVDEAVRSTRPDVRPG